MADAPGSNDEGTLQGLQKQVYADGVKKLVPDSKDKKKKIRFSRLHKLLKSEL